MKPLPTRAYPKGEPPTPTEKRQKSIVKRPFAKLERKMKAFEQRMANGAPLMAADAERHAGRGSRPTFWSSKRWTKTRTRAGECANDCGGLWRLTARDLLPIGRPDTVAWVGGGLRAR